MDPAARIVTVRLADQQYDIHVKPGLLQEVGTQIGQRTTSRRAFVVTDRTVGALHADSLINSLRRAGFDTQVVELPAGESNKTLATVSLIYDALLSHRIERKSVVFGLGGGVIGDMTGFAAATVLRGVPFVQVPTTLLAIVDASVGGKTGVNHAAGKNLIGAFHHPIAVMIDPETIATLPGQLIADGLAECIKHEIIRDASGFAALEQNIGQAIARDVEYLTDLIAHNVAIKAAVVSADPLEHGERAHLNLGHTFGHAIEKVSDFAISHGSAVSLGITAASKVALELGLLNPEDRRRIVRLLEATGLPTRGLHLDMTRLLEAMKSDKKVESGRVRLVLPVGIGQAIVRDDVSPELIASAFESLCS